MTQVHFDKLWRNSLNSETDSTVEKKKSLYKFDCISCGCSELEARPYCIRTMNISFKPDDVDNSDLPNEKVDSNDPLLFNLRSYYDSLPNLREALLICLNHGNIRLECTKCSDIFSLPENHSKEDLKRFINRKYPHRLEHDRS